MKNERCENCKYRLSLVQFDYSKGGCEHKPQTGFVCVGLAYDGIACWMVGIDENGRCEMYKPKMQTE